MKITPGIFMTGTDTSVGKTFVACAMLRALRSLGMDVGVMKPVETGCGDALVPADAVALREAAGVTDSIDDINPFRFRDPLAPSSCAEIEKRPVDMDRIMTAYREMAARHEFMVVEGAGGLLVPITDTETISDMANKLGLPLIVVARTRLGTINHTLLTLSHADRVGLKVAGIILNPADEGGWGDTEEWGRREIEKRAGVPILGVIPHAGKGLEAAASFINTKELLAQLSVIQQNVC